MKDYQAAADSGVIAFIQKVRTLKNPRYRNSVRYPVSDVTAREASAVLKATGVDTNGFTNILTGGAVDHIEKRHGASGKADKSMQDLNDLGRVGYILENFDSAELLLNEDGTPSVSDVWKNSDGTSAARVLFTKKVNGVYYTAVATPDSNAGVIAIESAFMSKEKGSTGTVLNMEKVSPQVTPEAPQRADASVDPTVPQGNSDVKEQGMQNGTEYVPAAEADNNTTIGVKNNAGPQTQYEPQGAEPAETEGQRADAVAAQDNLYSGDRGRGAAEPGTGGAGKLRRQTEKDRRNRALIQQRRERAWQQPLTSAAALGVQSGTSEETLHVLPESEWDEELRGFSDWARGKGVKRVTMVTGLMQVETENGAVGVRGVINRESGEMILCVDGRRSAAEIGRHEVGHFITEEENVRAFMDAVRGGGDWQGIYDAYEECYASLTANYIGMTAEQRALYVWEEILEDAYAGLDSYGQQASRYHEQAVSAIESAAEAPAFARSEPEGLRLRAADEPRSRGPPERYSLNEFEDGRRFVDVQTDQAQFNGLNDKQKTKLAIQIIKERFSGKVIGIDNRVFVNGRSAAEYGYPIKNISSDIRDAKMRASTELDNLIDAGTNFRTAPDGKDGHIHPNAAGDFHYFDTTFKVGNEYYKGVVNILPVSKGLLLKDITKIENITQDISSSYGQSPKSTFLRDASMNSISRNGGNVKPKQRFSAEEDDGEYLALAKDPERNREKLQEMVNAAADRAGYNSPDLYHGTKSFGFTEFDLSRMDDGISIFLTTNPVTAGTYTAADTWTPTHDNALVEREVNYAARRAFDSRIGELSSRFAGGIFRGDSTLGKIGLENETRWEPGEIAEKLANYPEVQAAYLQSKGESLEPERRSKQFDRNYSNETIQRYLDSVGAQEVARLNVKMLTGGHLTEAEAALAKKAIREVYAEEHANFLNRRPESKEKRIDYYMQNNVTPNRVEDFVRSAEAFYESGGAGSETDKEATAAKMFEMIAPGGSWGDALRTVKDWVQPQLDGLLGERGVYNGKDAVTDSGRRSFAETHWDYTAENIVKAMNMAADKGANMYGVTPETLAATATPEFRSVDEMHAGEDRLRTESQDAHDRALRDLGIELDRVVDDLMRTTKHRHSNTFEEEQALSGIIAEAAKGKRTASAVKAAFRRLEF